MNQSSSEMDLHLPDLFRLLLYLTSFRAPMAVTEVMIFHDAFLGETGYYVCPRCHITMEREFMSFCDRCGQRLDWKQYRRTKRVYPAGKSPDAENLSPLVDGTPPDPDPALT